MLVPAFRSLFINLEFGLQKCLCMSEPAEVLNFLKTGLQIHSSILTVKCCSPGVIALCGTPYLEGSCMWNPVISEVSVSHVTFIHWLDLGNVTSGIGGKDMSMAKNYACQLNFSSTFPNLRSFLLKMIFFDNFETFNFVFWSTINKFKINNLKWNTYILNWIFLALEYR